MSHAVFIKQKPISSFLSNEYPSFEFNVQYSPVVLMSNHLRGSFEWTRDSVSFVENTKGSLGKTVPTKMYLTPSLHRYSNFGHTHEMVIEHEYPNTIGNRKVFFVFFLQLRQDALMKTPLDSFLDKDVPQMDVQSFVQSSLNNNSAQKVYYQTSKHDHVFIFPSVITVQSSKVQELTGTPKPPAQVYNEVFLNDALREANRIPIENTKEIVASPLSYDITVKTNTVANNIKEGFNTQDWECYPEGTDENDYTVNIKMANDKVVNDIHNMFPMLALMFTVVLIFTPFTILMSQKVIADKYFGYKRLGFGAFLIVCLFLGLFFPCATTDSKIVKKGDEKTKHAFNMVGMVFIAITVTMYIVSVGLIQLKVKLGDIDFGTVTKGDDHPLGKYAVLAGSAIYPLFAIKKQKDSGGTGIPE